MIPPNISYSREEVGRLGEELYHRVLRNKVMPQDKGKFLLLDIETGDYEVDEEDLQAERKLRLRRPEGVLNGMRIRYASAYSLSGRMAEERQFFGWSLGEDRFRPPRLLFCTKL